MEPYPLMTGRQPSLQLSRYSLSLTHTHTHAHAQTDLVVLATLESVKIMFVYALVFVKSSIITMENF